MFDRPQPDWGRRGTQPQGSAGPPPRPNGRIVATKPGTSPHWVIVRCSECGKVLCEVQPGSTVKIKCRGCKAESVTTAA